jgi:hypothetical protein
MPKVVCGRELNVKSKSLKAGELGEIIDSLHGDIGCQFVSLNLFSMDTMKEGRSPGIIFVVAYCYGVHAFGIFIRFCFNSICITFCRRTSLRLL